MGKQKKQTKRVLFLVATAGVFYKTAVVETVKRKFDEAGFETKTIDLSKHIKDVVIRELNEFAPSIVVSANVVAQNLAYGFDGEIKRAFRDYFIMADYEVPSVLKSMRSDESFIVVPNQDFKSQLEGIGYKSDKVLPFGIPVADKFHKKTDVGKTLTKLGLPSFDITKPTVLMIEGFAGFVGVVKRLASNPEIQIITVCCGNEKLAGKISRIDCKAKVYNFVTCENIDDLMTLSHFYIGEADGASMTAAIAKGLHLVAYKKLLPTEEANFGYLEGKGFAKIISNMTELEYYVAMTPDTQNKKDVIVEHSADKIVKHALEKAKEVKKR